MLERIYLVYVWKEREKKRGRRMNKDDEELENWSSLDVPQLLRDVLIAMNSAAPHLSSPLIRLPHLLLPFPFRFINSFPQLPSLFM